jgi:hypothetical protein
MTTDDFRTELSAQLQQAAATGAVSVDINAGELHRAVGGYPGGDTHRMPMCCIAMYDARKVGEDEIISRPPKGKGASLTIRYRLPR